MTSQGKLLYEQIADDLQRAIERGEYAPGEPVPSEATLQGRYEVSRGTVRKALDVLTHAGVLGSSQGRLRYVRSYAPLAWTLSAVEGRERGDNAAGDAWSAEVRRQNRKPAETVEIAIIQAPPDVARRLHLEDSSDLVVARRRIRYVDDVPYQLADSYFPEHIARGTALMEPRSVSAPGGVLAAIGHPQVRYRDEITSRMPTAEEGSRLDLQSGTPVAELIRTGYDTEGNPLRVMVSVAPGDRNRLVYELDA